MLCLWSISVTLTVSNQPNAHLHSVIKYGITLEGTFTDSGNKCSLQKKVIGNMAGLRPKTSCIGMFQRLDSVCSMSIDSFINERKC